MLKILKSVLPIPGINPIHILIEKCVFYFYSFGEVFDKDKFIS